MNLWMGVSSHRDQKILHKNIVNNMDKRMDQLTVKLSPCTTFELFFGLRIH